MRPTQRSHGSTPVKKIVHRKPHIIVMGDVKQERERMEIEEEMQTKQRVSYKDIIEIS